MLKIMKKVFYNLDDAISVIALVGIIVVTSANIFFRYVLNSAIMWSLEVSLAFFVWLVFVGTSSAMKRDQHIGIDYFVNRLPKPLKYIAVTLHALVIYGILIFIFIMLGSQLAQSAAAKTTTVLNISYTFIDIAVPIGGVLTLIHFTLLLIKKYKHQRGGNN
jgi:TRAP-type transport system small permease protein